MTHRSVLLAFVSILCSSSGFLIPRRCHIPDNFRYTHRKPEPVGIQTGRVFMPTRRAPSVAVQAFTIANIGSFAQAAFGTSGVQKVLELGFIAGVGASLRDKLDAKAITALLLNALVPAVIVSSLSTLKISVEMGYVFLAGTLLALIQLGSSELASRFVIKEENEDSNETRTLRRTAGIQLGTMAPALSVYSFTREFVGGEFAGLAALADIPTKIYTLLLIPYYLRFRGNKKSSVVSSTPVAKPPMLKQLINAMKDPFNLAITSGIGLAALGRPVSSLGFCGKAIGGLAQAQTSILFLLIGLKLKFGGDRPKLCLQLLLARHGFVSLATSAFLATILRTGDAARLAAVLSSHAASSIIAFGQMSKVAKEVDGYDTELAFDIVALSFPLTVLLNTIACLAGKRYVDALPIVGTGLLAMSALLGKIGKS
mmetsp:Transcript_20319/g.31382  ORF Transcript_20319/g.31382 Transcript_20319/m.31382 type:complete len:427 (-) Transcript_20319:48-1328(-)